MLKCFCFSSLLITCFYSIKTINVYNTTVLDIVETFCKAQNKAIESELISYDRQKFNKCILISANIFPNNSLYEYFIKIYHLLELYDTIMPNEDFYLVTTKITSNYLNMPPNAFKSFLIQSYDVLQNCRNQRLEFWNIYNGTKFYYECNFKNLTGYTFDKFLDKNNIFLISNSIYDVDDFGILYRLFESKINLRMENTCYFIICLDFSDKKKADVWETLALEHSMLINNVYYQFTNIYQTDLIKDRSFVEYNKNMYFATKNIISYEPKKYNSKFSAIPMYKIGQSNNHIYNNTSLYYKLLISNKWYNKKNDYRKLRCFFPVSGKVEYCKIEIIYMDFKLWFELYSYKEKTQEILDRRCKKKSTKVNIVIRINSVKFLFKHGDYFYSEVGNKTKLGKSKKNTKNKIICNEYNYVKQRIMSLFLEYIDNTLNKKLLEYSMYFPSLCVCEPYNLIFPFYINYKKRLVKIKLDEKETYAKIAYTILKNFLAAFSRSISIECYITKIDNFIYNDFPTESQYFCESLDIRRSLLFDYNKKYTITTEDRLVYKIIFYDNNIKQFYYIYFPKKEIFYGFFVKFHNECKDRLYRDIKTICFPFHTSFNIVSTAIIDKLSVVEIFFLCFDECNYKRYIKLLFKYILFQNIYNQNKTEIYRLYKLQKKKHQLIEFEQLNFLGMDFVHNHKFVKLLNDFYIENKLDGRFEYIFKCFLLLFKNYRNYFLTYYEIQIDDYYYFFVQRGSFEFLFDDKFEKIISIFC